MIPVARDNPNWNRLSRLTLERAKSLHRLHTHLAAATTLGLFLLALNAMTGGLGVPWSLWPISVLLLTVLAHCALTLGLQARRYESRLHDLEGSLLASEGQEDEQVAALRSQLLRSAEEARASLRTTDAAALPSVTQGEAYALQALAWLDNAHDLLARRPQTRQLRREMAATLSKPGEHLVLDYGRRLMAALDLHEERLTALEREAHSRRSLVESFLLALGSAGMAGTNEGVLAVVGDPIRERLAQLAAVAAPTGHTPPAQGRRAASSATDRFREEVRLAQDLQQSILPPAAPEVTGLRVAHVYRPSNEVGGDFYDFYATGPQRLLVAVGDASGHGLDSSMVSSMAKSALYTHVAAGQGLDLSMAEMNRMMCDTLGRRRLMTLVLLEVDTAGRRVAWVNAGHVYPLLRRRGGVRELARPGYPLGIRRDLAFEMREEKLEPGDLLLVFTDGYVEAMSADGEVYGWERLVEKLATYPGQDAEPLVHSLVQDLGEHLDGLAPQDDVTLVALALTPEGST